MFMPLMCFHFVTQVLSEAPPGLPQNVLLDNWQLTWTPATEERNVTYTVRYLSFDTDLWKDVPTCKQMSFTSCNVAFMKAEADHGCAMIGVLAERTGLTSEIVTACSSHGNSCSPEVVLSAHPGFLTVHLSRNSGFALEGYHVKHRIYFGKEGEPLQAYEDAVSSVTIPNVKEGEHYCASVQYTYFDIPVGVASCTRCKVIPNSSAASKKMDIIVAVVIVLVVLIPLIAYVLLFQKKIIKKWLQPPYKIPDHIYLDVSQSPIPISSDSSTEICNNISSMDFIEQ